MTDQLHDDVVDDTTEHDQRGINRRRMFLAGAGLAGAAVVAKAGSAEAADPNDVTLNETKDSTSRTGVNQTASPATPDTPGTAGNEALYGNISDANNGSHAILGNTGGVGHAVAGTVPADAPNGVAATWGRHAVGGEGNGGAGVGGLNIAENVELAGAARGVEGIITQTSNGSHAVYGETMGAGHSVAGDTPADAEDGSGGPNMTAATWGRHQGMGAGIGGVSAMGYGGEFVGGKGHVRLIQVDNSDLGTGETAVSGPPAGDDHLIGELFADGDGNLYYNRANGSNFTQLNNQGGMTLLDDPQRAYDSREEEPPDNSNKGRFDRFTIREIDLTEFTDYDPDAQGAVINITIDDPSVDGYATVFNGDTADDDRPLTSTINFWEGSLSIANGIIVKTSSRGTVKVYTHNPCEVIIDVVGMVN